MAAGLPSRGHRPLPPRRPSASSDTPKPPTAWQAWSPPLLWA